MSSLAVTSGRRKRRDFYRAPASGDRIRGSLASMGKRRAEFEKEVESVLNKDETIEKCRGWRELNRAWEALPGAVIRAW